MTDKNHIIYNAIKTPDGTILESRSQNDYHSYKDANGYVYMVDGGQRYLRRKLCPIPYEDLTVYSNDPHHIIRKVFRWHSKGEDGSGLPSSMILHEMTDIHISNVLEMKSLEPHIRKIFNDEVEYRIENEISI